MPHFVTVEMIKALEKEIDIEKSVVASGSADDHSKYKWMCGVIHGFRSAVDIIKAVDAKYEKDDD